VFRTSTFEVFEKLTEELLGTPKLVPERAPDG
jgi:hypothetical protein